MFKFRIHFSLLFFGMLALVSFTKAVLGNTDSEEYNKHRRISLEKQFDLYLKRIMEDPSSNFSVNRLAELEQEPDKVIPVLIDLLHHDSDIVKSSTMWTLSHHYGTAAKSALPEVAQIFQNEEAQYWVVEQAALTIGAIADNATTAGLLLANRLNSLKETHPIHYKQLKRNIAKSLGMFDSIEVSQAALPALLHFLNSSDSELQYETFMSLGKLSPHVETSLTINSIDELMIAPPPVQYAVLERLMSAGVESQSAQHLLLNVIADENAPLYLRARSIEIITAHGAGNASATNALLKALEVNDRFIEHLARMAMRNIDPDDRENIAILTAGLRHTKELVRYQAALGLRNFGPEAASAMPELIQALLDVDGKTETYVIGSYLDALRAIGPQASPAADALLQMLLEKSKVYSGRAPNDAPGIRSNVLLTMADIGNVPDDAFPYIAGILSTSNNPYEFAGAARAAGAMGPRGAQLIPLLIRALNPEFRDGMFTFVDTFSTFALSAEQYTNAAYETVKALRKLGAAAKPALPALEKLKEHRPDFDPWFPNFHNDLRQTIREIKEAPQS